MSDRYILVDGKPVSEKYRAHRYVTYLVQSNASGVVIFHELAPLH